MNESGLDISQRKLIQNFTESYMLIYFKSHPDSSGYDLSKHIKSNYGWNISCSRIYPLLDKMTDSGVLSMREDRSKYPPRKLYRLTPKGRKHIKKYRQVFLKFLDEF
jgi:DNA-binding PadR family transcriptional regulator